jgi:dTDP-4-amino-4,6-dideoxygalactose transaminase
MSTIRKEFLPFGKPSFSTDEIAAVSRVLQSGWIGMGPETVAFEGELSSYFEAPHVVTVNSCTSALFLSLLVSGVGAQDEVICPSFTWCSTANAALYLGAKPVFCDIDPETLNATPESIRSCLSERTKAVIVVHMGGLAADMDAIRAVLPENVALIEDAAHALGATYPNGRPVGSSDNLVCFSFYANKNLSTGEGGAVALHDPDQAARLRSLRLHALPAHAWQRFSNARVHVVPHLTELGYKMNYTDLQAAIGRVQLRRIPEFAVGRQAIADAYLQRLPEILPGIKFQAGVGSQGHAKHLFLCLLPDNLGMSRDELLIEMRKRNIGASLHYEPLHVMPLYAKARQGVLPVTERVGKNVITLPIGNAMTTQDVVSVTEALKDAL